MDMFEQPAQALRPWGQSETPAFATGAARVPAASYPDAGRPGPTTRPGRLARSIEADIVPRLLLSHRGAGRADPSAASLITGDEVAAFTDLVLVGDIDRMAHFIDALRARGTLTEALFLDLLGPSAARLGTFWEDDVCSFGDVTLGMLQLHRMLNDLIPAFHAEIAPRPETRRALLVPAPGEQHGLGLKIVAAFMRRAGWSVWCGAPESRQALVDMVRHDWFALVGLSTACETHLDSLKTAIRLIRRASRNPAVGIMVGGPVFIDHPDLAAAVGADATAVDGRHAAQQAETVLDLMPNRG
jgi:methanogenic corrinoid protein MtbC1